MSRRSRDIPTDWQPRLKYCQGIGEIKAVFSISNNRIKSPLFVFVPIQAKAYPNKRLAERS